MQLKHSTEPKNTSNPHATTAARRPLCGAGMLFAATLILGGCMVGPDYVAPDDANTPDTWSQELNQSVSATNPELSGWWKHFNDPELNNLIGRAQSENLNLKAAITRINEARSIVDISNSEFYPQFEAGGAATAYGKSKETNLKGPHREDEIYDIGLSGGWEADLWGRIRRSVESAEADYQATIEDYRDTLVLLYSDIATSYINLRTDQERIRLAEENIKKQQATLKLTKTRNKAGIAPTLDVRQAELNLAATESALPTFRQNLARNVHRISVLTGSYPGSLVKSLSAEKPIPQASQEISIGIPADMLRQRPDIRAAERRLAAQSARIGVAQAELYPTFTLPGSISLEAFDGDQLDNGMGYGIGPSFRWNLFSGGRVRAQIYREETRTKRAEFQYQETVLEAMEDVQNALVAGEQERIRKAALKRTVVAASDSVDLVTTLYKSGLTDFQNVLDMERALTLQEDTLAQSQGKVAIAQVRLYRAMGGGWEPQTFTK